MGISSTLDHLVIAKLLQDITLGANARSAASVLKSLWHKHAQLKQLGNGAKVTWDWMQELSKREDNWLFF